MYGAHEAVPPAEGQGPPEAGLVQQAGQRVEQPGQPEPELGQLVGQQAGQPESPEARLWLRAEQRVEGQAERQAERREMREGRRVSSGRTRYGAADLRLPYNRTRIER